MEDLRGPGGSIVVPDHTTGLLPKAPMGLPDVIFPRPRDYRVLKTLDLLHGGDLDQAKGLARWLMDPMKKTGYFTFDPDHRLPGYGHVFYQRAHQAGLATAKGFHVGLNGGTKLVSMDWGKFFRSSLAMVLADASIQPFIDGGVQFIEISKRSLEKPAKLAQRNLSKLFQSILFKDTALAVAQPWLVFLAAWSCQGFLEAKATILRPLDGFRIEFCRDEETGEYFYRRSLLLRYGSNYESRNAALAVAGNGSVK